MLNNSCKYRLYPSISRGNYNYIIVELRDVIERYLKLEQYYTLYRRFPLKEMISVLLSVEQEKDYSDYIFSELENRLGDLIDSVDLNYLELFFEFLIKDIDDEIKTKCPSILDTSNFILDNWISEYAVILKKIN